MSTAIVFAAGFCAGIWVGVFIVWRFSRRQTRQVSQAIEEWERSKDDLVVELHDIEHRAKSARDNGL